MSATINVLKVSPLLKPVEYQLDTSLEGLQKAVDGFIDIVYPFDDPVGLLIDDEGKIKGKDPCRALIADDGSIYDVVAGDFFVVGLYEDTFRSLTAEETEKYYDMFKAPEFFRMTDDGIAVIRLM